MDHQVWAASPLVSWDRAADRPPSVPLSVWVPQQGMVWSCMSEAERWPQVKLGASLSMCMYFTEKVPFSSSHSPIVIIYKSWNNVLCTLLKNTLGLWGWLMTKIWGQEFRYQACTQVLGWVVAPCNPSSPQAGSGDPQNEPACLTYPMSYVHKLETRPQHRR